MPLRITADWSGAVTGLASSTFYFIGDSPGPQDPATANAAAAKVRAFFVAIGASLPTTVSVQVNPTASVLNSATGLLEEQLGVTTGTAVAGDGGGGFPRAAGGLVSWLTGAFVAGRSIRGRTFLVPLAGASWGTDGLLAPTTVTRLQSAGTAFIAGTTATPVVWHRPKNGAGGSIHNITAVAVPTDGAILSSRRD